MMQKKNQEGGFSLLEVAIAMSTVAILSFGVMFGFTLSSSQDREAYELQRSQAEAQRMIEIAESLSYSDLLTLADGQIQIQDLVAGGIGSQGTLDADVTVTQIEGDLLAITATVRHATTGAYEVSVTTLKTQKQESL